MAPLCAELGISRKTGDKVFKRSKECGLEGLADRSGPLRQANQLSEAIETLIVRLRREYPTWELRRSAIGYGADVTRGSPATSTGHAVLDPPERSVKR